MKHPCFVIVFFFLAIFARQNQCYAQVRNIDSLKQMLISTDIPWFKTSSGRVFIKRNIAAEYQLLKEYDKANVYLDEANKTVDSCLEDLAKHPLEPHALQHLAEDKAVILADYGDYYFNAIEDYDKALLYYQKAVAISTMGKDTSAKGYVYSKIARVYVYKGDFDKALDYYNQSLALTKSTPTIPNSNKRIYNIASSYIDIGLVYQQQGNYNEALSYFNLALPIYKEVNRQEHRREEDVAATFTKLGSVYLALSNYPEALKNYLEAFHRFNSCNYKQGIASSYLHIGDVYKKQGNYDDALSNYKKALDIFTSLNSKEDIALSYSSIGILLKTKGQYNESLGYITRALDMTSKTGNKPQMAINQYAAGDLYYSIATNAAETIGAKAKDSLLNLSITYYNRALDIDKITNVKPEIASTLISLANSQIELGKYNEALKNCEQGLAIAENIHLKSEIKNGYFAMEKIAEKKGDFKKALSYYSLWARYKDSLLNENTNKQLTDLWVSYKTEQKNNEIDLLNKDKQIQTAEIKRQSFIRNFSIVLAILILLFAAIMVNRFLVIRKQKAIITAEKKINEQLFQSQVTELEGSAKRAQMNPHFVFNSLNSIQNYIWNNNPKQATEYLTRFAKLIRLVLEHSRSERVTLEKDLSALEYYIQLEALRFGGKFQYSIVCEPGIDKEEVLVPPMIIQPFVENAILHGLYHKKENGRLLIKIRKKDNNKLQVIIEDNGVGRVKAKEISYSNTAKPESLGMQVTRERLESLSNLKVGENAISITDLFDELRQPCGTKVEIEFPLYEE